MYKRWANIANGTTTPLEGLGDYQTLSLVNQWRLGLPGFIYKYKMYLLSIQNLFDYIKTEINLLVAQNILRINLEAIFTFYYLHISQKRKDLGLYK